MKAKTAVVRQDLQGKLVITANAVTFALDGLTIRRNSFATTSPGANFSNLQSNTEIWMAADELPPPKEVIVEGRVIYRFQLKGEATFSIHQEAREKFRLMADEIVYDRLTNNKPRNQ